MGLRAYPDQCAPVRALLRHAPRICTRLSGPPFDILNKHVNEDLHLALRAASTFSAITCVFT